MNEINDYVLCMLAPASSIAFVRRHLYSA